MSRWRVRKDPVTPEVRAAVLHRDQGCVAPRLGASGLCSGRLLLDHIKDEPRMGVRAPSDVAHLVAVCEGHSENGSRAGAVWNTANRPALRAYLAQHATGAEQ